MLTNSGAYAGSPVRGEARTRDGSHGAWDQAHGPEVWDDGEDGEEMGATV